MACLRHKVHFSCKNQHSVDYKSAIEFACKVLVSVHSFHHLEVMANNKNLLLLFERPSEPVFTPKGKEKAVFQVPDSYFVEKYQSVGNDIRRRLIFETETIIEVADVGTPDLSFPEQLDKSDNFSLFIPKHRKMAAALTDLFLSKLKDFGLLCLLCTF